MSNFNSDAGDSYETLTKVALLLEGRNLCERSVKFPEGSFEVLHACNRIAYGGSLTGEELGELLYHIADIMEGADNWE